MNSKETIITKSKVVNATLSHQDWIKQYILLWNGIIQLTEAEIDLLHLFITRYLQLKESIKSERELNDVLFSTRRRKEIKESLGISEQVFNNRFTALKRKGVIKEIDNSYKLDNKIVPLPEITFKFNIV